MNENGIGLLNLQNYIEYGILLKDYMLKIWEIASLSHKRSLQKLLFPEGIFYDKKTDDIKPASRNEFLFVRYLNTGDYGDKENGQILNFEDLSALAPPRGLEPRTP